MLSKSLSTSRKFRALLDRAGKRREFDQILFALLVAHADDFGRLEGDPFTIKALCYPSSPRPESDFADALKAMHDVGLIALYQVDGNHYVQVVQFDEHQVGLHKRTRSRFPDPPAVSGNFPEIPSELKGTELKNMGDSASPVSPRSDSSTAPSRNGADRSEERLAKEFRCVVRPYYPAREGDQRWQKALSHFRAARKAGEPLHVTVAGTIRYAKRCDVKGLTGTAMVKQAATFFGPEKCWREPWGTAAGASKPVMGLG
jgi:hypothetical protein